MRRHIIVAIVVVLLATCVVFSRPDLVRLGPDGGDVRSLAIHPSRPDRVYLGTADGQLFVSDDRGENWHKLYPGLGRRELVIDCLVFDPVDPEILYAGGWELKSERGGLYRTLDGGSTWEKLDLGRFQSSIRAISVSPSDSNLIAVGISEGVVLSRDAGKTWDRITRGYRSLHKVHSLAFDPRDGRVLYVGTWRLAWRTDDLGKSWTAIHKGMYWDSDLFSIELNPENPDTIVAGACSGVYRSFDRGGRWTKLKRGLPGSAKRTRVIRFDPLLPSTVYAGTTAGLYRSLNGGNSWKCLFPNVVINAIVVHPEDSDFLILGTDDAGVLVSRDGGQSFEPSNHGFIQRQISAIAVRHSAPDEIFVAVTLDRHYGGVFRSRDNGSTWEVFNDGLGNAASGIGVILPAHHSERVFLGTSRGVYEGIPGESGWRLLESTSRLLIYDMDFAGPDERGLFLATDKGIYRLALDTGMLYRSKIAVYDREVTAVVRTDGGVFVGTEMGVFRSDDGGKSWEIKVEGLPYGSINAISSIADRLLCANESGLFFSDDRGESWHSVTGLPDIEIDIIAGAGTAASSTVFAADHLLGYLLVSDDRGQNWQVYDLGLEISRISAMSQTSSGRLLAGTVTEGVVQITTSEVSLASQERVGSR